MTRTFVTLLLAASALAPVAVSAQQVSADARTDWRGRGGEMRAEGRVDRPDRPQQQQTGDDDGRGRGQGPDQRRDDRQDGRQDARPDGRPDGRNADQTRGQFQGNRADGGRGDDGRWDNGRPDRGQGDRGRGDRGQWNGGQGNGGRNDGQWNNGGPDRGQWGSQNRSPNQTRGGYRYDGNRDQQYGRNGFDDRRAWNRGWRNDNRYAWNDYRTSNRGAYRLPRYYAPRGWGYGYRRFGVGFTLSSILFNQNYWIQDPYTYRLPEAYGPYRWVRYYNDALLVDLDSGRVVDTVYDIFW